MLAQQFSKTKSINNSDICFQCLHIYRENKDVLSSDFTLWVVWAA